jgi:hypothetical protein
MTATCATFLGKPGQIYFRGSGFFGSINPSPNTGYKQMPNQQKLAMLKNSSQAKRRLLRVKPFAAAFPCVGPGLVRILIMGIIPPMVLPEPPFGR